MPNKRKKIEKISQSFTKFKQMSLPHATTTTTASSSSVWISEDTLSSLETKSNRDEPLEEVERVLTYLASASSSLESEETVAEASELKCCCSSEINKLSLDDTEFNREVEHYFENPALANTSKDEDENDENAEECGLDRGHEQEKKQLVQARSESGCGDEDDSLEDYINQFQKSKTKSSADFDYEEPAPLGAVRNSASSLKFKEQLTTEITVTVREEDNNANSNNNTKNTNNSKLMAILLLKERKSKSLGSAKNKMANIYSSEFPIYSPLQRSQTRWLVYSIGGAKTSIATSNAVVHEPEITRVSSMASSRSSHASSSSSMSMIELACKKSSPTFSMNSYASQFRKKQQPQPQLATLSSYEAADEDYFTEAQPQNSFIERPLALVTHLGVVDQNPDEYKKLYANELFDANELPVFINKISAPHGLPLAHNVPRKDFFDLEGDLQAFKYIDLDKEGLSEYRDFLTSRGIYN